MRNDRVEVAISDHLGFANDTLSIAILMDRSTDTPSIGYFDTDRSQLQFERYEPLVVSNGRPSMTLRRDDALLLYNALDKFFRDKGIRADNQTFMEGELQAMRKHLKDLQKIIFKEKANGEEG